MILWQLFISYLKIGFFGFGGGSATLAPVPNGPAGSTSG